MYNMVGKNMKHIATVIVCASDYIGQGVHSTLKG